MVKNEIKITMFITMFISADIDKPPHCCAAWMFPRIYLNDSQGRKSKVNLEVFLSHMVLHGSSLHVSDRYSRYVILCLCVCVCVVVCVCVCMCAKGTVSSVYLLIYVCLCRRQGRCRKVIKSNIKLQLLFCSFFPAVIYFTQNALLVYFALCNPLYSSVSSMWCYTQQQNPRAAYFHNIKGWQDVLFGFRLSFRSRSAHMPALPHDPRPESWESVESQWIPWWVGLLTLLDWECSRNLTRPRVGPSPKIHL